MYSPVSLHIQQLTTTRIGLPHSPCLLFPHCHVLLLRLLYCLLGGYAIGLRLYVSWSHTLSSFLFLPWLFCVFKTLCFSTFLCKVLRELSSFFSVPSLGSLCIITRIVFVVPHFAYPVFCTLKDSPCLFFVILFLLDDLDLFAGVYWLLFTRACILLTSLRTTDMAFQSLFGCCLVFITYCI